MVSNASSTAETTTGGPFAGLAAALPPFSRESRPESRPESAARYLAYYGLEFAAEFPGLRHGFGTVASSGHRLALHSWEQPLARHTLLIVHGYFDHVGLYGHLVRFGLRRGFNVVAFDLPGHGLSSGPSAEIGDFSEYRQSVADVLVAVASLPGHRHIIAQSTGGAAVMDYLLHGASAAVGRVVLLAPLVRPAKWRRVVFAHRLLHRFVDSVPRQFAQSSQDREFLDFLRGDPLQSRVVPLCWIGALRQWLPAFLTRPPCDRELLVVQGDADDTVDWRYNLEEIRRLFPRSGVLMLPSARHQLANERSDLREIYLAAVGAYLDGREIGDITGGGR